MGGSGCPVQAILWPGPHLAWTASHPGFPADAHMQHVLPASKCLLSSPVHALSCLRPGGRGGLRGGLQRDVRA